MTIAVPRPPIRCLAAEEQIVTPPTIDDPAIIAEIRTALRQHRVGQYAHLPLSEDDAEGNFRNRTRPR